MSDSTTPTIMARLSDGSVIGETPDGATWRGQPSQVRYRDLDVEHVPSESGGCVYRLLHEGWVVGHGIHDADSCWGDGEPTLGRTPTLVYTWEAI